MLARAKWTDWISVCRASILSRNSVSGNPGFKLGCASLLVLTDSEDGEEPASWFGTSGTIRFMPLWRWLLESSATPEEINMKAPSRRKR